MLLKDQMKFHELQALWWMHSASNGHSATRNITFGNGRKLDKDDLRDDAMKTAQHHLTLFRECAENKPMDKNGYYVCEKEDS